MKQSLPKHAALVAALMLAACVPAAQADAPNRIGQPATLNAAPPAFDGRVLVRIAEPEAAGLRRESARGLERMRAVSPVLRGLSATHNVRRAAPAVTDGLLFPEARAVGLDRWFLVEVDPGPGFASVAARLRALYGVEFVEPDRVPITLTVVPNDSLFSKNWGHGNTATFPSFSFGTLQHTGPNVGTVGFDANVQGGWGAVPGGFGDSAVVVAILDTGVRPDHPDLRQVAGWDYFANDAIPEDTNGHGTSCAGVAAGWANNTKGVAGAAGGCKIMPLRTSDGTSGTVGGIANAILHTGVNGAEVASMSFELARFQLIADALTAADAAGVVLLAATGNNNLSVLPFPANHPKVIAVGAASPCASRKRSSNNPGLVNPGVSTDSLGVSCDNETWWGSTWGVAVANDSAAVDIVGPTMLPTTTVGGYTDFFNGTSCATPYVAGIAALIRSQHPTWTPAQVRQRLVETAIDIADVQSAAGWDKYTGYGMVNAGLPELFPTGFGGWASAVVPRLNPDATFGSVPAPATLNGDVNSWVSMAIANSGEATSGVEAWGVNVDGVQVGAIGHNTPPGAASYILNVGIPMRGGRHVLGSDADPDGSLPESNETNNRQGHQWSLIPANVPTSASAVVSRLAPPDRLGGRPDVPGAETTYDNVDAVRMVGPPLFSSLQFWAIGLHPSDTSTDLDLIVHNPTTTATNGFVPGTVLGASALGAGATDWVFFHLGNFPIDNVDAASLQYAGSGQSRFESRLSEGIANSFNGSTIVIPGTAFVNETMIMIHDLSVQAGGAGPVTLELTSSGPLHMAIYDPSTTIGARLSALQVSGPVNGVERLSRTLAAGRHPLVVYRDRAEGSGPLTYSITVRRTPAELVAVNAFSSYAPSGPFRTPGDHLAPPTQLDGNVNNTIFFYTYSNTGPTQATGFQAREHLDGDNVLTWTPGALNAASGALWYSGLRNIRGGRHTMGYENDVTGAIAEFNEANNDHASQWVWSPLPLTLEVPLTRATPPNPTGGWADVTGTTYYNVDGLRTPHLTNSGDNAFWSFFALMPRNGGHDPDLGAWQPVSTGPSNGFGVPAEESSSPAGRIDFVGVDVDGNARSVDLGTFNVAGSGNVVVHSAYSRGFLPLSGTIGPFTLGPDSLIAVVELNLPSPMARQVRLKNLSGNANLELHTFNRTDGSDLYNPTEAAAYADAYGDGGDEVMQVNYPQGFPAVVVTKRGTSDLGKTAVFEIELGASTVDVPDELPPPTAVRLAPVVPNPVSNAATIAFDLPRESAVELSAYDVSGRRVATVASGSWPAGRHSVRWSAVGANGAKLASGVYLLRLDAAGTRTVQRMVVTN